MITPNLLALYLGGVVTFTESISIPSLPLDIERGAHKHITPGLIHMVATGRIPAKAIKLVLRRVDQLEDAEVLALSYIAAPPSEVLLGGGRTITRQGKGRAFTLEVSLTRERVMGRERTFVINADCAPAMSDIIFPPFDGQPVVTHLALPTQPEVTEWLINKHIDVFGLVRRGAAVYRQVWGASDYETPETLAAKYS